MKIFVSAVMVYVLLRSLLPAFMLPKYIKKVTRTLGEKPAPDRDSVPDMEILIHLREGGRFGHCDVVFDGKVVSYGNYDKESFKLGRTFGHGIFFTADRDKYLRFCADYDNRTTVCYGLRLNRAGVDKAKEEVEKILEKSYPWTPPFQKACETGNLLSYSDDLDYCSKLWFMADGCFRKFHSGLFKSYFAFSKNCALLVGEILKTCNENLKPSGLIKTPGKLFKYLERLLNSKNNTVFSRTVYGNI